MKSKFSFWGATYKLAVGLAIILIGLILIVLYFIKNNESEYSIYPTFGFILLLLGITISLAFFYLTPSVQIDEFEIRVKSWAVNYTINIEDVASINLLSIKGTSIGVLFSLNSGKEVFLEDNFYSNIFQIKEKILEQFGSKVLLIDKPSKTVKDTFFHKPIKFTPSWFSILTSSFFVFCILCVLSRLNLSTISTNNIVGVLITTFLSYLVISYNFNYLILTDEKIKITNYILFWKKYEYDYREIVAVNFVTVARFDCLRILTFRNQNKIISLDGLTRKQWIELLKCLKSLGVYELESTVSKSHLS